MKSLKTIEFRFILCPFATSLFTVNNMRRKGYYVFGIKIMDLIKK